MYSVQGPGRMAQTPQAGTGHCVSRFRRYHCSTLINYDSYFFVGNNFAFNCIYDLDSRIAAKYSKCRTSFYSMQVSFRFHITHISMTISANLGRDTDHNSTKLVCDHPLVSRTFVVSRIRGRPGLILLLPTLGMHLFCRLFPHRMLFSFRIMGVLNGSLSPIGCPRLWRSRLHSLLRSPV